MIESSLLFAATEKTVAQNAIIIIITRLMPLPPFLLKGE